MSYMKQLASDIAQVLGDIELTDHIRRDRWGRYMAKAEVGKKPKAFTRATTVAATNEDTYNLEKRTLRFTVSGLSLNSDLVAAVRALDPETDKDALDKICKNAAHQAGADFKAEYGTALHHCFAMSMTNPGYVAPESFATEVAKIHAAIAAYGFTVLDGMVERMIINRHLGIAGTFDLIVTDGVDYYIADLKSGDVAYGVMKMAIQGTIYALPDNVIYNQGSAIDGSEDTEEPMPKVSPERSLIINARYGQPVTLHWLDLNIGDEGLRLALETRAMRNAKPITQIETPIINVVERTKQIAAAEKILSAADGVVDDEWREWMRNRVKALAEAGHTDLIRASWPEGVPTLGSGEPIANHLADPIEQAVSMIEREVGAAFPTPKPTEDITPAPKPRSTRRPAADEGPEVGLAETQAVNKAARALTPDGRAWLGSIMAAAKKANRAINMTGPGGKVTERRFILASSLLALADHSDDDLARSLVSLSIGEEIQPGHDLGDAIGALTISEATRLGHLARALNAGSLIPTWEEHGVRITGDIEAAVAA